MAECHRYIDSVQSVLLIGLGGGSLVHYYRSYFPWVHLDVVEIDPMMIALAYQFFGVAPSPLTRITCDDACRFVQRFPGWYDVAYVDPFLTPSAITTASGHAACIQTPGFLAALCQRLRLGGVAAFNCHDSGDDINVIRRAFPVSYVLPATGAKVVLGVNRAW